jgi:bifunctional DNase/RNase
MWLAAALTLAWLATASAAPQIEVEVRSVRVDPDAGSPVVELVEKSGRGRQLPIWIGPFEAQAIAVELQGLTPPRPLTHDLMGALVQALDGRLERVVVHQLVEGTYHARLELARAGGSHVALDARPSDALALALRLRRPIFVDDAVFAASTDATGGPARAFGLTLQDLTPELADVLALSGLHGALVTDVDPASAARKLRRADVVTAVDGESVASAADLVSQLERRRGGQAMRVALRRHGQPLEVRIRVGAAPPHDR